MKKRKKYQKRIKILICCENCNKEVERFENYDKPKHSFCSKECKYAWFKGKSYDEIHGAKEAARIKKSISTNTSGENNGNYGNAWNDKQRKKASELKKKQYDENPDYRYAVGASNRGKKFNKKIIDNMRRAAKIRAEKLKGKTYEEIYGEEKAAELKRQIGEKSKKKFTLENKARYRKIQEDKGNWIPLDQIDDYKLYLKFSNWQQRMFDIVIKGRNLIKEYGIFNAFTNSAGCVRDHIYSRRCGFKQQVFPEVLRHPANCQIILHSKNVNKGERNGHTLDELFDKIIKYKKSWHEQEKCLELIARYKQGHRYNKQEYINQYYES